MDIDLPDGLTRATPADWRQLADITAEAFAEDPVNTWMFDSQQAIQASFRVLAREIYARNGFCHLAGNEGATMWLAPDQSGNMGLRAMVRFAVGQLIHGSAGGLKRAMAAGDIMEKHHPREPHCYLFTIGTRKSARGTGLGKALLAPVLKTCDAKNIPCYLENSNPDNHGFYAHHGFERREIFACGEGGPPLEAMWREPR